MKRPALVLILLLLGLVVLAYPIGSILNPRRPSGESFDSQPQNYADLKLGEGQTIKSWSNVEDFPRNLAVFETVFWDPRDTTSLRQLIRNGEFLENKSVLEIGTGSGLLALCCLKAGAEQVVATDVNPAAIANARFNQEHLQLAGTLDVRQVSLDDTSAFAVLNDSEKFDVIISNPPWVNQQPQTIDEYALYDESFALMKSMIEGLPCRLKPGGRMLLAYGCVDAIRTVQCLAKEHGFSVQVHDDRNIDELAEEFLPGMLLEIRLPDSSTKND